MIHNDIQNQLQLLIRTAAPPLIEVAEHATGTPQWTPGQRLPAHVLASLPNGRFEVKVGDQILDLNLPRNTQAGDTLELTYITSSPRLTFALTRDLAGAMPANTPVSLSDAAKFIGTLLQRGVDDSPAAQAARTAAVVAAPPTDAAEFARSLRQAVSQSGLFYESHQAQWVSGERSLGALLQEPQGQLSPRLGGEGQQAGLSAADGRPGLAARAGDAGAVPAGAPGPDRAAEPVHPQAAQLVQQQLQALDTRQIVWQGQVWPGQDMRWEIEEDAPQRGGEREEAAAGWRTHLNLQLPSLGGVSVRLAFAEGAVRLDIAADQAGSADRMRAAQSALTDRFSASGLRLSGVTIRHE